MLEVLGFAKECERGDPRAQFRNVQGDNRHYRSLNMSWEKIGSYVDNNRERSGSPGQESCSVDGYRHVQADGQ